MEHNHAVYEVLLDGPLHISFIDWKYNTAANTVLSF
jgi:hypothetical protein